MSRAMVLKGPEIRLEDPPPPGIPVAEVDALVAAARAEAFAEGRRAAESGLQDAVVALTDQLRTLAEGLHDVAVSALVTDAGTVADLAAELAAWYLGQAIASDPALLAVAVRDALDQAGSPRLVGLRVHPAVAAAVGNALADRAEGSSFVRVDPSLAPTDFVIETDGPVISSLWADALARLRTGAGLGSPQAP